MGSTKRVVQVINTAAHVANFLYKTGRILKAIELSKELMLDSSKQHPNDEWLRSYQ